jgi:hypothetical protein
MNPEEVTRRFLQQEDGADTIRFAYDTLLLKALQLVDYSATPLEAASEQARTSVEQHARGVYGDSWHFYSGALRREVVRSFELSIRAARKSASKVAFLEIGSCQGVSMSLVGAILRSQDALGTLCSIDPYYEGGYLEGGSGPWRTDFQIDVNKTTRDLALKLYGQQNLPVELLEMTSQVGLSRLIREDRRFSLIYIDGSHEHLNPMIDFGLSRVLLAPGGVVMLDDHHWPDVVPVREMCKKHMKPVTESWKIAAFQAE